MPIRFNWLNKKWWFSIIFSTLQELNFFWRGAAFCCKTFEDLRDRWVLASIKFYCKVCRHQNIIKVCHSGTAWNKLWLFDIFSTLCWLISGSSRTSNMYPDTLWAVMWVIWLPINPLSIQILWSFLVVSLHQDRCHSVKWTPGRNPVIGNAWKMNNEDFSLAFYGLQKEAKYVISRARSICYSLHKQIC